MTRSDSKTLGQRVHPEFLDGTEACANADPELFFATTIPTMKPAKRICRGCPLRDACLEFALATDQRYGIWGATSPQQRRAIAQNRAAS